MATPLVLAAFVEARRWDGSRHQRKVEVGLVIWVFLGALAGVGFVDFLLVTLFGLGGARLILPRTLAQRRQLVFMSFLAFLTTTIVTFEPTFLLWALVWMASAMAALLHQAWETGARWRSGPPVLPPFARIMGWLLATLVGGALCFVLLPRTSRGLRVLPLGFSRLAGSVAGLNDRLILEGGGPILPRGDVVLRILPGTELSEADRFRMERALAHLRGITLERLEGTAWEPTRRGPSLPLPPLIPEEDWRPARRGTSYGHPLEFALQPDPFGIIPTPYGSIEVTHLSPLLRTGPGNTLRWAIPSRRSLSLRLRLWPDVHPDEARMTPERRTFLTHTTPETAVALRWSRRIAPEDLPPEQLVARLTAELSRWTYTLDNPSGKAQNPLEDFLERSKAGHCEYYASALALALRHRGIPSRIVNGYRLGPWSPEGSYWIVTPNEAHAWVEWWDETTRRWIVADPTPPAPPSAWNGTDWSARLQRWADALRFQWDRYVVRFSGRDQEAGWTWLQARIVSRPEARSILPWVLGLAALVLAARGVRRWHRSSGRPASYALRALAPLVRAAGPTQRPAPDETLRSWIERQIQQRPQRREALERILHEAERVSYDDRPDRLLKALIRQELRAWRNAPSAATPPPPAGDPPPSPHRKSP